MKSNRTREPGNDSPLKLLFGCLGAIVTFLLFLFVVAVGAAATFKIIYRVFNAL